MGTMRGEPWATKTAVVCGASAGLGAELARALADQGVGRLLLLARSLDRLNGLADELRASHPRVATTVHAVDLVDCTAVEALARSLSADGVVVDLLIQAVGASDRGRVVDLTPDRMRTLIDVNVVSSLNALQLLGPRVRRPGGAIVMIGSLASKLAPRHLGGYAVAKHALAALAGQARLESAAEGVHVLLACPGPIARDDAGARYGHLTDASDLPPEAARPGGGAKIRGLDPRRLARDILAAAAARRPEIIRPRKARLLVAVAAIAPRLGDRLLRRFSS